MNLKKEFIKTIKNLEIDCHPHTIIGRWNGLQEMYSGRDYHNLHHIKDVLITFDKLTKDIEIGGRNNARLAIFYHDAIYIPSSLRNELESYLYALACIPKLIDYNIFKDCIMITRHLDDFPLYDGVAEYVADADLAGLADSKSFESNGRKIRAEYPRTTDKEFVSGRIAFFVSLLQRKYIFRTLEGRKLYELPTRANIADYIRANT